MNGLIGQVHARCGRIQRFPQTFEDSHIVDPPLVVGLLFRQHEEPREEESTEKARIGKLSAGCDSRVHHLQDADTLIGVDRQVLVGAREHPGLPPGFVNRGRLPRPQALEKLVCEPWRRSFRNQRLLSIDGLGRSRVDLEPEARRVLERSHHANRVLLEALIGIADSPDHAVLEILDTADVIDDRKIGDIVKQRVDREITAARILGGRPVDVLLDVGPRWIGNGLLLRGLLLRLFPVIGGFGRFRAGSEGRHLDDFTFEVHMHETESAADDSRVPEQAPNLLRARVGGDVEILWTPSKQEIAHAAPHQVAGISRPMQSVKNLDRLRRKVFPRQLVLGAGQDPRHKPLVDGRTHGFDHTFRLHLFRIEARWRAGRDWPMLIHRWTARSYQIVPRAPVARTLHGLRTGGAPGR